MSKSKIVADGFVPSFPLGNSVTFRDNTDAAPTQIDHASYHAQSRGMTPVPVAGTVTESRLDNGTILRSVN